MCFMWVPRGYTLEKYEKIEVKCWVINKRKKVPLWPKARTKFDLNDPYI